MILSPTILTILTIFFLLYGIIVSYLLWKHLLKSEYIDDIAVKQQIYINNISSIIEESKKKIQDIDSRGTFKSDDEIGYFFNSIKEIQDVLNNFIVK